FDALPEHRVTFGHVRADNQETFGVFDIIVARRRTVVAEGHFIGIGGAGHAKARVGVHVVRADETLGELVENVLRLGSRLARNIKRDRIRTASLDDVAKCPGGMRQRLVKGHGLERSGAVMADLRGDEPVWSSDNFADLRALHTNSPESGGMRLVALDLDD